MHDVEDMLAGWFAGFISCIGLWAFIKCIIWVFSGWL